MGRHTITGVLLGWLVAGCSLALDFDALQSGAAETGGPASCQQPEDCDDGVACTQEVCEAGVCQSSLPDNSRCAHLEMCDRGQGCVPTGKECKVNSDCDDGVGCTVDTCAVGTCRHTADSTQCEDPNPCVVGERCDAKLDCQAGAPTVCDQSAAGIPPCHRASCDSTSGACDRYDLIGGADDDSDGYYDRSVAGCAEGNDCDDADALVHPGAKETCDGIDNDCDNVADAASVFPRKLVLAAPAGQISTPASAVGDGLVAVIWQEGSADSAAVQVAFFDAATGEELAARLALSAEDGADANGHAPAIVALADNHFAVAWIKGGSEDELLFAELTLEASGKAIVLSAPPEVIGSGGAGSLGAPQLVFDPSTSASGWVASWTRRQGADVVVLARRDVDLASGSDALEVSRDSGSIAATRGLSVAVIGANDYVVAMARAGADGDLEVLEARLDSGTAGLALAGGSASVVSAADPGVQDPSSEPCVVATGGGTWLTAFTDVKSAAGQVEHETDIRAVRSSAPGAVVDVLADASGVQQLIGMLPYQQGFALVYEQAAGVRRTLDLRLLDSALAPTTTGSSRFADSGLGLIVGPPVATPGGLALTFVERGAIEDHLYLHSFSTCSAK